MRFTLPSGGSHAEHYLTSHDPACVFMIGFEPELMRLT